MVDLGGRRPRSSSGRRHTSRLRGSADPAPRRVPRHRPHPSSDSNPDSMFHTSDRFARPRSPETRPPARSRSFRTPTRGQLRNHSGLHRTAWTASIDCLMQLSGEAVFVLEDAEVRLAPGDWVVVNGVTHIGGTIATSPRHGRRRHRRRAQGRPAPQAIGQPVAAGPGTATIARQWTGCPFRSAAPPHPPRRSWSTPSSRPASADRPKYERSSLTRDPVGASDGLRQTPYFTLTFRDLGNAALHSGRLPLTRTDLLG